MQYPILKYELVYPNTVINFVGLKTDDLPVIKKDRKYDSEDDYLNTYFRLLREECFHKLRKGISDFREQKCDSRDLRMYR